MIAASFASLSSKVSAMHKYLAGRHPGAGVSPGDVPENPALERLADALGTAAREYCALRGLEAGGTDGPAMLMVVQPGEMNAFDQQWISAALWERHGVDTVRRTLAEVEAEGAVGEDGGLTVGGRRVACVYLRSGYAPTDYPSAAEWDGRFKLEASDAPKCPTVAMQIAGAKKVQQQLAAPGVTERFVGPEAAARIREVYAGQWSFEDLADPATADVVRAATADPRGYVLKPQREGGGNNVYGEAIVRALEGGGEGLAQYILMQRIEPPLNRTLFLRNGEATWADSLSELGVYGTLVTVGDVTVLNETAGHLLRTKLATSDEGGVAAGFAVLDSPVLG